MEAPHCVDWGASKGLRDFGLNFARHNVLIIWGIVPPGSTGMTLAVVLWLVYSEGGSFIVL